jgi:integrase
VGTLFKSTTYKDIPAGAELFTRKGECFARWEDGRGNKRVGKVVRVGRGKRAGHDRLKVTSRTFFARYRDGGGVVRIVPTGCRDEQAARSVLNDLETRAEKVKAKVLTLAEDRISAHQETPLGEHFDAYLASLAASGVTEEHRANVERQLNRLAADCSFGLLADLNREALERWLANQAKQGMGGRTRNTYLSAAISFANWCADPTVNRLTNNPFTGIAKANEKADPRRPRRAMTETELVKLLAVARQRPLLDALTVRKGPRKGERYAKVRPEVQQRLETLGRERALIYKTLVLTGLRKGELASLTVGQLDLDGPIPCAFLDASDEKNREGSTIALRDDVAADLKDWLAQKLEAVQNEARHLGEPILSRLRPETSVFDVPDKLSKILNRDLRSAGIA